MPHSQPRKMARGQRRTSAAPARQPPLPSILALLLSLSVCVASPRPHRDLFRAVNPASDRIGLPGRVLTQNDGVDAADFPYLVSLRRDGDHFCGGVLLAPDLVVTGASCVSARDSLHPEVRIGFSGVGGLGPEEEAFASCTTIVHGGYDGERLQDGNDIALLVLNGSSGATPAKLPSGGAVGGGEDMVLAGFRRVLGQREVEFRVETVLSVETEECEDLWTAHLNEVNPEAWIGDNLGYSDNLLCSISVDGLVACGGDSGNPVVATDGETLLGIVSFGPQNCFAVETPSVSTSVSEFLDFISKRGGSDHSRFENPDCVA
eukprot:evm.model.scf_2398.4 EVM.evm.TU.scf_2398.4   scf_2398:22079-24181(+)